MAAQPKCRFGFIKEINADLHNNSTVKKEQKLKSQNVRLWCRSVTHPVARSHHGLLLAAQFVEDVVGELDAARPQLPCKGAGHRTGGCEREGGSVHRMSVFYSEVDNRKKVMTFRFHTAY